MAKLRQWLLRLGKASLVLATLAILGAAAYVFVVAFSSFASGDVP